MLGVSERKLEAFTRRYLSTVRPVLLEHPRADGVMAGFTDNYLRVVLDAPVPELSNTVVPVRILAMNPEGEDNRGEDNRGEVVLP